MPYGVQGWRTRTGPGEDLVWAWVTAQIRLQTTAERV